MHSIAELVVSIAFAAIATTLFALLIGRRFPFAVWSPVYGVPLVYLILGVTGYLYYSFTTGYRGGFYDLGVSESQLMSGLAGIVVAIGAFVIGALLFMLTSKRAIQQIRAASQGQPSILLRGSWRVKVPPRVSLGIVAVPLVLLVIGKGPESIMSRADYITEKYHYLVIAGSVLVVPAMLALGFLSAGSRSIAWRAVCLAIFSSYVLLLLSLSTRLVVVAVLLFIFGLALRGKRRSTIVLHLAMWVIALPLLLNLPLSLRVRPEQGIVPLAANLIAVAGTDFVDTYLRAADDTVRNVAFGVPLAAYVQDARPISFGILMTSLNPLPSFVPIAGIPSWETVSGQLRITTYIPYSGIGELLNHGLVCLVLYYVAVGIVAAWVDIGVRASYGRSSRWGFFAACALMLFFALYSTQYNLRSDTRLLYYTVLVAYLWQLVSRLRFKPKSEIGTVCKG